MSQDTLESVLHEERVFKPSAEFVASARIKPADREALLAKAAEDHAGFWADLAREELLWKQPFTISLDDHNPPFYKWFTDGVLNVSYNCIDRHLPAKADRPAIVFESELDTVRTVTFQQLHDDVCQLANALRALGIGKGDRVVLYMPMVPEAVVGMQACARIGAIHSVVFGGFSAEALKDRVEDAGARAIITADGSTRGGRLVPLKANVDKALELGCATIEKVITLRQANNEVTMAPDRDLWWQDLVAEQPKTCEPEWVAAEHPLFLLYTSGSTGKPKGVQHSSAGYLLNGIMSMKWVFDIKDDDVFWCTADVGWITGHSYVAYAPLAVGVTQVVYEGVPTQPDPGRWWRMVERHKVSVFYTAPTALRALMKQGDAIPAQSDLACLRVLGTVGEPINPEAWMWYYNVIGGGRCPIVDTWWQTETGANMIAPMPGAVDLKPGSCTKPLPGIDADVVDEEGHSVTNPNEGGYLVIRKPWPSMLRTIWQNDQRYVDTYWGKFQNRFYVAGDSAHKDAEGNIWILGRIDDVINVSGHRMGTMEVESALVAHPKVAEAAVVGKPHEVKGESIFAYVVLKGERPEDGIDPELTKELRNWVAEQIGAIAKPDDIRYADNLPKTRSGKIMRRLLRSIARGEDITQDTSTLENEQILAQLKGEA